MSYLITYNGTEQQSNLYARVKRLLDGKFWNAATNAWDSSESVQCNIAMTEDVNIPGKYSCSANFTPANGSVLLIFVYSNSGALIISNTTVYKSDQMTALQLVQEIQGQLRLPKSPLISDAHAQLLLSFINEVQLNYMMEFTVWDEQKVEGSFKTVAGISVYNIAPVNGVKVDFIRYLQIPGNDPIPNVNDDKFKADKSATTSQNIPTIYRHYGRSGGGLIIELCPVPDQVYQIDFELLQKPVRLSGKDDVPLLDQDTILLGTKFLAKKDQGDDYQTELSSFQAKLSLQAGSQSGSNYGDVEFY